MFPCLPLLPLQLEACFDWSESTMRIRASTLGCSLLISWVCCEAGDCREPRGYGHTFLQPLLTLVSPAFLSRWFTAQSFCSPGLYNGLQESRRSLSYQDSSLLLRSVAFFLIYTNGYSWVWRSRHGQKAIEDLLRTSKTSRSAGNPFSMIHVS